MNPQHAFSIHSLKAAAGWALVGAAGAGILLGWHSEHGDAYRVAGALIGVIGYFVGRLFDR
jgi:hypothetical protein